MSQTFTKMMLSGSDNGEPIFVAATSTAGTTIHTATSSTGTVDAGDEIWIWAGNIDATPRLLTLQFGDQANAKTEIHVTVPAVGSGPIAVVPGLLLKNSRVLTATAAIANKVNVYGFVNRISS